MSHSEEIFDAKRAIEFAETIYEYLLDGLDVKNLVLAGPTPGLGTDGPSGR